jgi:hypothetical protein
MIAKLNAPIRISLAAAFGAAAVLFFVPADVFAQSGYKTFCYRGRTMTAPDSIADRYLASGATPGACATSAP